MIISAIFFNFSAISFNNSSIASSFYCITYFLALIKDLNSLLSRSNSLLVGSLANALSISFNLFLSLAYALFNLSNSRKVRRSFFLSSFNSSSHSSISNYIYYAFSIKYIAFFSLLIIFNYYTYGRKSTNSGIAHSYKFLLFNAGTKFSILMFLRRFFAVSDLSPNILRI